MVHSLRSHRPQSCLSLRGVAGSHCRQHLRRTGMMRETRPEDCWNSPLSQHLVAVPRWTTCLARLNNCTLRVHHAAAGRHPGDGPDEGYRGMKRMRRDEGGEGGVERVKRGLEKDIRSRDCCRYTASTGECGYGIHTLHDR